MGSPTASDMPPFDAATRPTAHVRDASAASRKGHPVAGAHRHASNVHPFARPKTPALAKEWAVPPTESWLDGTSAGPHLPPRIAERAVPLGAPVRRMSYLEDGNLIR
jgi:hypothetical protein